MNSEKRLSALPTYVGMFIGTAAIAVFYDYLKPLNLGTNVWVLFLFLVFVFIVEITRGLCQALIHGSSVVRRIILLGDYIEGLWRDVCDWDGKKSYGFYIIRYHNGSYEVVGREFDSEGKLVDDWNSVISSYDGNCLLYLYQSRWAGSETIQESYGMVSLSFMRGGPGGIPKSASGYFIDIATNFRKVATRAEKVSSHGFGKTVDIKGMNQMVNHWINEAR